MLPIHVYYAIDLVRERQREEARRNAIRREQTPSVEATAPRAEAIRRTVARGALAVSAGASAVARAIYEQAVDGPGVTESSLG